MATTLVDLGTDLEQLLWQDIQSDGLIDAAGQPSASQEDTQAPSKNEIAGPPPIPSAGSPVSSMTDVPCSAHIRLQHAVGDAGSGSVAQSSRSQQQQVGPSGGTDLPTSDQMAEVGPFASLEHHQRLASAPSSAGPHLPGSGSLNPNRSIVTYKTRALAAAAGSLRTGAVGSGLRLAAFMCRSNSGGLADTLMAEHVRAEAGLLTGGLARSDSLPELSMAPSAADLAELVSLRDLDFLAGMPAAAGLPSLSMLFSERPAATAAAAAAAAAPGAQGTGASPDAPQYPAPAAVEGVLQAAGAEPQAADEPSAWFGGGARVLGRPQSFTANGAAALFGAHAAAGSSAAAERPPQYGLPLQEAPASTAAAAAASASQQQQQQQQHQPLKPPTLVDYSQMIMLKDPAAAAAPSAFSAPASRLGQAAPAPVQPLPSVAAPLGGLEGLTGLASFSGFSLPSFSRLLSPLMDRQDTFELLMSQVNQELAAEAEIKQYAALEIDTIDVPLPAPAAAAGAAAAAAPAAYGDAAADAVAAAVVPAVPAAAAEQPAPPKRRSAFQLTRPSVFEGPGALLPADPSTASAVPAGTPAVLEPVGPSFASWAAPADPSASSQASGGSAAALAGFGAGAGAASPFCLPAGTAGLMVAGDSSAASDAEMAAPLTGKQEVARYSRVITCKTYLKRLNITQPMAEHLLPVHDLSLPPKSPLQDAGGEAGGDEDDQPKRGTYEQLFKDQIIIVDEAGGAFRVQYEGVSCNAQKHLRLTCGWRDYIRAHDVEVGDTVVFERRGDQRSTIYVTLVKACDAPVDLEPAPKKRRVGRKQAVQRLD